MCLRAGQVSTFWDPRLAGALSAALDHAADVLEQRGSSLPRKSRKAVRTVLDSVERLADTVDAEWCDRAAQSYREDLRGDREAERRALREELGGLRVMVLHARATSAGVEAALVDDAMDGADAKATLIEMILEKSFGS
eukprot:COSAG04_NODE_9133_length_895_cov_0.670854_2_plen_138_part_00